MIRSVARGAAPLRRHVSSVLAPAAAAASPLLKQQQRRSSTGPAIVDDKKNLVFKTLRHVGDRQEVERYLKLYANTDIPKYVVIQVSGNALEEELDTLAGSLSFLHAVGLQPVVVHGIGRQLTVALQDAGINSRFIDGLRETPPEVMQHVWAINQRENLKLVKALEDRGTRARPIVAGVFEAEYIDEKKFGAVGKVSSVNPVPVFHSLECGHLPVLSSIGLTATGQLLNLKTAMTLSELIKILRPIKIVYLHPEGGLSDEQGKIIPNVDLDIDYQRLVGSSTHLNAKKVDTLRNIKLLLDEFPHTSSVSITNAINLPRELFTHTGSGTLIKRAEKVHVHTSLDGLDTLQLFRLIETSLNGKLLPNYIDFLKKKLFKIYVTDGYRAVAILTKGSPSEDVPFLDEFAAGALPENDNVANLIWDAVIKDNPKLFWRTTGDNVMNSWYLPRSNGSVNKDGWTVFWTGIDFQKSHTLLPQALQKPETIRLNPQDTPASLGARRYFSTDARRTTGQSRRHFSTSTSRGNIGLIGARGHTGAEILKILDKHPYADITVAGSRGLAGQSLSVLGVASRFDSVKFTDVPPERIGAPEYKTVQAWILALPNDLANTYVKHIDQHAKNSKVIDLSADYRFDKTWAYGLPEQQPAQRDRIRNSNRISNPGCYATGTQLSLFPLADILDPAYPPTVFGVSGYSGAGTTPSRKNDTKALKDNMMPYALQGHMHEKEVSYQLQSVGVSGGIRFMPHVASWFRGIALTIAVQVKDRSLTKDAIVQRFQQYYKGEPLVKVTTDIPEVRDIAGNHGVTIGGFSYDQKTGRLVLTTCIDNLLKGAATQCVQNLNLAMGWPQYAGIQ